MMTWRDCKNILCIRLDNMGDLIMTSPALAALKQSFGCKITVLTSSMAVGISKSIPCIDDVIVYDVPWVRSSMTSDGTYFSAVEEIKKRNFDGAIVFTVFSQNPMPAIMLAYLAGIPRRASFCRENPYDLLTHWLPDKEPYDFIQHQVRRDLELVERLGAKIKTDELQLTIPEGSWTSLRERIQQSGMDLSKPWILFHPGVSEEKRKFPLENWIEIGRRLAGKNNLQILITGSSQDKHLTSAIASSVGENCYDLGGSLSLDELIVFISKSPLLVSVNTGTIHIAAATKTPVVVLYALTNPQHAPWHAMGKIIPFSVPSTQQSKNEVLRYVTREFFDINIPLPSTQQVADAIEDILINARLKPIPELIIPESIMALRE